jgi:hypothetical protein
VADAARITPRVARTQGRGWIVGALLAGICSGCSGTFGSDSKPDEQRVYEALAAAAAPLRECLTEREARLGQPLGAALVDAQLATRLEARSWRLLGRDAAAGIEAAAARAAAQLQALRETRLPVPDVAAEPAQHFGARAYVLRRAIEADLFVAQLPAVQCEVSEQLLHEIEQSDGLAMVVELLSAMYPLSNCMGQASPMPVDGSAEQAERFVEAGRLPLLREIAGRYLADAELVRGAEPGAAPEQQAARLLQALVAYADPTLTTEAFPLRARRAMALAELTQLNAAAGHPQCAVPENLTQWMDVDKNEYL